MMTNFGNYNLVTIKSEKKFDYFLILNESSFLQLENNPPTQNFAHFCIL